MSARICVVTRVAKPETGGNLTLGDVWLDPQAKGASNAFDLPHTRLATEVGNPALALYLRVPVFTVGEMFVLDHNDRDPMGRKPSKWDVDVEVFTDLDEAVRCARAVAASEPWEREVKSERPEEDDRNGTVRYMAPVEVEIEDGEVTRVVVDDASAVLAPEHEEGDPLVRIAEAAEWPSWDLGR